MAAYRIGTEALANCAHHSGARHVDLGVSVEHGPNVLCVEVTDDGTGVPDGGRSSGVGLGSMHERAEELGGSCRVTNSPAGGTCVRAVLPLQRVDETGA